MNINTRLTESFICSRAFPAHIQQSLLSMLMLSLHFVDDHCKHDMEEQNKIENYIR